MHNGKSKKSKQILTIALASLIVLSATSAAVMSGCGENSESTNETKTVTETELVTVVVDETYATDAKGNTVSAESKGSDTSSNGNGNSQNNESSSSQKTNNSGSSANSSAGGNNSNNSSSSKSNSSNNNNNNNSNSSGNNSSSSSKTNKPSSNTHKPVTDSNVCTLDGNKFAVGDTVTCVYKLTSPEKLENYQAEISYDTKYLSVKSAYLDGPADSGGLLNYNLNGKIKFNGSNISKGYNYTKEDNFVVVNYEIKATGSTTPTFTWIVATGVSGKAYVKDNKATGGLKIAKEYM
ncbi:MAG: cohesin domain-containing protein [Ruminococcus sp.]